MIIEIAFWVVLFFILLFIGLIIENEYKMKAEETKFFKKLNEILKDSEKK